MAGNLGLAKAFLARKEEFCGPPCCVEVPTFTLGVDGCTPGAMFPPGIGPTLVDGPAVEAKFHPKGNPALGLAVVPKGTDGIVYPP